MPVSGAGNRKKVSGDRLHRISLASNRLSGLTPKKFITPLKSLNSIQPQR